MTSLLPAGLRRTADSPPGSPLPSPAATVPSWLRGGALAALRAAALGLLSVAVVVILAWASAEHSGSSGADALGAAGQVWLVAHHVPLRVPGGAFGLAPLGLQALPVTLLVLAGRRAARTSRPAGRRPAALLTLSVAGSYGAVTAAVAALTSTPQVSAAPAVGFLCGATLGAVAGGYGIVADSGASSAVMSRISARNRTLLSGAAAGAVAGVAILVAGGALLAGLALAVHADRATALARATDPGAVGGLLLTLLGAVYVPNAAVWGAAVAVGPGFAVGEGTTVNAVLADVDTVPGAVPTLPLLGALPDPGPMPLPLLGIFLLPVAAGTAVALVGMRRRTALGAPPAGPWQGMAWAAGAGLLAGALFAGLAALAGGPVAGGPLSAVGPSPWRVGLAAGAELAAVAAAVAYVRLRLPREFVASLPPSVRSLLRRGRRRG